MDAAISRIGKEVVDISMYVDECKYIYIDITYICTYITHTNTYIHIYIYTYISQGGRFTRIGVRAPKKTNLGVVPSFFHTDASAFYPPKVSSRCHFFKFHVKLWEAKIDGYLAFFGEADILVPDDTCLVGHTPKITYAHVICSKHPSTPCHLSTCHLLDGPSNVFDAWAEKFFLRTHQRHWKVH